MVTMKQAEDTFITRDYYKCLARRGMSLTHGDLSVHDYTNKFHLFAARAKMVKFGPLPSRFSKAYTKDH